MANKEERECDYCGKTLFRYSPGKRVFCDINHKKLFQTGKSFEELHGDDVAELLRAKLSAAASGDKNANYGNAWSLEQKENARLRNLDRFDSEFGDFYRHQSGSANRGVKFSKDRIKKMHDHRTFESYSRPLSEERKTEIGIASKAKFTPEYKIKQRTVMEDRGFWTPLSEKKDSNLYQEKANWIHKMYGLIPEEHYKNVDQTSKNVRDHIIPRWVGYEFGVFVEIIRHPLNCQIISHRDNIKKGYVDKKTGRELWIPKIEDLITKILEYKSIWEEQDTAILRCIDYRNGMRRNKNEY